MQKSFPTALIIFGATGDLMGKKIVPSLWHLFENGKLPQGFEAIGLSRREFSEEQFRAFVRGLMETYVGPGLGETDTERFLKMFSFVRVAFESDADFESLSAELDRRDGARGPANRLMYMAVPPEAFPQIFGHPGFGSIVRHGEHDGAHTRVIIEKPFGTDAASAEALEEVLAKRFSEEQIYRADHYVAKAVLRNIPHFRFGSEGGKFEGVWNSEHIASITIRTWETLGVETRGSFYDALGTLRDVGQNHLLEMLALVAMERPEKDDASAMRDARAGILGKLRIPNEAAIKKHTFRAQYESYRDIEGVKPGSETETYYRLTAYLDTPRWQSVPIMMEAGKRINEWCTEIIVSFKKPGDKVIFRMRPKEEIIFSIDGNEGAFPLQDTEPARQYVAEYARILTDATAGNQKLFVCKPEIQAAWRFIDPIIAAWKQDLVPLAFYKPDTDEAIRLADAIIPL